MKKNIYSLFAISLFLIFLFEILLRISAVIPQNSSFYINDQDIGFRMRPEMPIDNRRTNKNGFNDIDHDQQKKINTTRIAIIGDSFVVGVVKRKNNFVSSIQDMADREGLNIEMLNMGIAGAGPDNYLALINNDAVSTNSDIVGVMFFVGNDIVQSHPDFKTKIWLGSPNLVLKDIYNIGYSTEYFYIYRAARYLIRLFVEKINYKNKPIDATFSLKNYLAIEYQRSFAMRNRQSKFIRKSYQGTISILKKMSKLSIDRKKKFFVILAPDELQVNRELQNMLIKKYSLDRNEFDFELPQKILSNQLEKSGILFIDLLPFFKKQNKNMDLYEKQDSHWNEEGNSLAADKIWIFMKEHILSQEPINHH